jgi:Flp pilus assembly protein TadD
MISVQTTRVFAAATRVLLVVLALTAYGRAADPACGKDPYECAESYIKQGKYDLAVQVLNPPLAKSPRDLKALNLFGVALAGKGQVEEATRELRKALRLDPRYSPALRSLAAIELGLNQTAQAKGHLEQALKLQPADPAANLLLGKILYRENRCDLAVRHFNKSGDALHTDTEAILGYAQCSLNEGDSQVAKTKLTLLPLDDSEAHFKAGKLLAEAKDYAAAAAEFGMARKNSKDPYLAGYNQALAYVRALDYDAAVRTANELLNLGFETAELANVAGTAYMKNGQSKEAYNALRLATHLDPNNEESYIGLCEIALDKEEYNQGLEIADIGLSHVPKSDRLYVERGVMRAMKGQFDEAEQDFASANKLAPDEVLPSVALGLVSMQKGDLSKAIALLRESAQRHPHEYFAQYWYAVALIHAGAAPGTPAENDVLAALEASVQANPDFWHSRAELGKILLKRGKVDRAIVELERATALNPNSTTPLYLLAQAYRSKGEGARAQELLARVSKMQQDEREDLAQGVLKRAVREGTSTLPSENPRP